MIYEVLAKYGYQMDKLHVGTDDTYTITFKISHQEGYKTLSADSKEELIDKINEYATHTKVELFG